MAMVMVGGTMFALAHHTWTYVEKKAADGVETVIDHRADLVTSK